MAQKTQQVFSRTLDGEPTDHQRKFVYLPLSVFRDYTNVRSLVIEKYKAKKDKHPPEFVIKKTVEKYHKQLSQLNRWDELGLDKLDYKWPDSKKTYVILLTLTILSEVFFIKFKQEANIYSFYCNLKNVSLPFT